MDSNGREFARVFFGAILLMFVCYGAFWVWGCRGCESRELPSRLEDVKISPVNFQISRIKTEKI